MSELQRFSAGGLPRFTGGLPRLVAWGEAGKSCPTCGLRLS